MRTSIKLMVMMKMARNKNGLAMLLMVVLQTISVCPAYAEPLAGVFPLSGECKGGEGAMCQIQVRGKIDLRMAGEFESLLKRIRGNYGRVIAVHLDSEGGDVVAAQKMGESLRKDRNHAVFVDVNHKCFSACVFVLAGGVQRFVEGQVGIHRPYYQQVQNFQFEDRQQRYAQNVRSSKEYLSRMNIRDSLVDAMILIPPEKLAILSVRELSYYGLNQNDPVFEEMKDDMLARRFGLSKGEYLRRKNLSDSQCPDNANFDACMQSIMTR